jgi:DNA polymerase
MVACAPWLNAELALVRPEVIVCLGAVAAKSLLGKDFRITQHRGEVIVHEFPHGPTSLVPTLHPAAVLRSKGHDRDVAFKGLVDDLRLAWTQLKSA